MLRRLFIFVVAFLLVLAGGGLGYMYWLNHQPKESVYDPQIVSIARATGVDPFLVRALIWRESRFHPDRHGEADEHGLMQVTPEVGEMWAKANKIEDFKADDLYDPETNIRAGTWYLHRALERWSQTDDPVTFALAEYNAGRKNALKWVDPTAPLDHSAFLDRITFPGTRLYVERIISMRDEYQSEFKNNRWYRDDAAPGGSVTRTP